jgi:hypothetical protein
MAKENDAIFSELFSRMKKSLKSSKSSSLEPTIDIPDKIDEDANTIQAIKLIQTLPEELQKKIDRLLIASSGLQKAFQLQSESKTRMINTKIEKLEQQKVCHLKCSSNLCRCSLNQNC